MKPVTLMVDDDIAMGELLSNVLDAYALEVLVCQTGGDALARVAQRTDIVLVLLDMILPDTHGLQVLQQLQRTRSELPVVMLSGLGSESDVVVGLEMSIDDYIAKPFGSRVVVTWAKAILRCSGAPADETSDVSSGLTFNDWRLDIVRCEPYNPWQQAISLTQGECGLLLALAQNARRVSNREQLLALTHNESTEAFDRIIDVLAMRLRRKIELNPHQSTSIKTLHGLGYIFSVDATHSDKTAQDKALPTRS